MLRRLTLFVAILAAIIGLTAVPAYAVPDFNVLVFSRTAGFRHVRFRLVSPRSSN